MKLYYKMSDKTDLFHHLWQNRDFELKDENVPLWKVAACHRENINQLHYELFCGELSYDSFSRLRDIEAEKYASVTDGKEKAKGLGPYCEEVEALVPKYKENMRKFTSGLSCEEIMNMSCVKTALKQCETLSGVIKKEIEACGDFSLPAPPEIPKESTKQRCNSNSSPKEILQPTNSNVKLNTQNKFKFKNLNENKKPFSIYQAPTSTSVQSLDGREDLSRNIFGSRDTRGNKRKFNGAKDENCSIEDQETGPERKFHFKSAREQLEIDQKKNPHKQRFSPQAQGNTTSTKKSLGARPRTGCFGKFVPPSVKDQREQNESLLRKAGPTTTGLNDEEIVDPRLKGIEPKIIELVTNEIMDHGPPVQWDDIAGLEFAKSTIKEIVIWPMLRPDIFTGLRGPPKGILLFGPPGTGKTLIGKCIASQSGATFFSISASSLTSKWVGEGEKMVRALFAVASCHQPAVIFIDEIDSLLSQRSDSEHESSRRIKTEFLVQLDGAATSSDERILVVGATNRPQEIDEAARRRLSKRLYIPLPVTSARKQIIESLLENQNYNLENEELDKMISETDGYSGADMANLCREAALGPIRSLQGMDISAISKDDVRPITIQDFEKALFRVRPSVSKKDLTLYEEWNKMFGCCAF